MKKDGEVVNCSASLQRAHNLLKAICKSKNVLCYVVVHEMRSKKTEIYKYTLVTSSASPNSNVLHESTL